MRKISGLLFTIIFYLPLNDLAYLLGSTGEVNSPVILQARHDIPHFWFHVMTPVIGMALASLVLVTLVAFGPYRRGEKWAWWALVLASLVVIMAKLWGTLTIYTHHSFGGLAGELLLPGLFWVLAVVLSWRDFRNKGVHSIRR